MSGAANALEWVILGLMVVAAWLGALGFAKLQDPLDRMHCVTFVNAVCGTLLLLAAMMSEGLSDRVLKILLMICINLIAGAAISHATARALVQRRTRP